MPNESAPKQDIYDELKKKLLSGQLSLIEFKDKLIDLDQSTLDRKYSIENLKILKDEDIVNFIEKQAIEIRNKYFNFLSFTEFHVGQFEACEYKNQEKALLHFKESLMNFEKGDVDEDYRKEWGIYIRGTIAYLENDIDTLTEYQSLISSSKNSAVLLRLKEGLIKRGAPDYNKDY